MSISPQQLQQQPQLASSQLPAPAPSNTPLTLNMHLTNNLQDLLSSSNNYNEKTPFQNPTSQFIPQNPEPNQINSPMQILPNPQLNTNIQTPSSEGTKTKLENKFSFWYRISEDVIQYQTPKQALDKKEYEVQVKKIAEFDTVEDFWGIFQHLRKPDSCKPGIEFQMFKEPIKPMWEDENNKNGGRISIKLCKDYTTIIWEEMIFALIGGILPQEMKDEINGIVVTSRKEFNTLQIWFKTYKEDIITDLVQCIRDLLLIPPEVNVEVKQFNKNKNDYNKNNNNGNNNKKYGGYHNKGFNNYYGNDDYENEDKNEYKKRKYQGYKNK